MSKIKCYSEKFLIFFLILFIPYTVSFRFLEESVPWLVAKHRFSEAEQILRKMGRMNGIKKPLEDLKLNRMTVSEAEKSLMDLASQNNSKTKQQEAEGDDIPKPGVPIKDLFCDSKLRIHLLASNLFW